MAVAVLESQFPTRLPAWSQCAKSMMKLAASEMQAVAAMPELSHHVSNTGTLDLYDSRASFDAAGRDWEEKAESGFTFSRVGRDEIEQLQPGLAPHFKHAMYSPDGMQVRDPYEFTKAIADLVISRGATMRKGEASGIATVGECTIVSLTSGQTIEADKVIVACGAWSKTLAASLRKHRPAGDRARL